MEHTYNQKQDTYTITMKAEELSKITDLLEKAYCQEDNRIEKNIITSIYQELTRIYVTS